MNCRVSSQDKSSTRRHRIIQVLSLLIAFFGAFAIYNCFTAPQKYHAKYQTIAHRFLDREATYMNVPDESYELLDAVITEVKLTAHYDPTITDRVQQGKQLRRVFSLIDSVLIERNFIFPTGEYTSTLGEALADHPLTSAELEAEISLPHNARRAAHMRDHADENFHLIACEPNAFLYMGVAEALGFQLEPVDLPQHVFIRAKVSQNHWINWDPNRGRSISDAEYVHDWGVQEWQIRNKIFMHPLTATQIDADMYPNIGVELANNSIFRGLGPAMECYRKALQLDPNDLYANNNLATCLLRDPDPSAKARAEAHDLAQHAVDMQPNDETFHMTLAYAWAADGQTDAAVREVNRAIELDPQESDPHTMLPLIQSGMTMYAAFRSYYPVSYWIQYEHGWLYIPIFVIVLLVTVIIVWCRLGAARNPSSEPTPTAVNGLPNLEVRDENKPRASYDDIPKTAQASI
jgi:Transglutaminase-like superfamily